jgi:hypothetical protein
VFREKRSPAFWSESEIEMRSSSAMAGAKANHSRARAWKRTMAGAGSVSERQSWAVFPSETQRTSAT